MTILSINDVPTRSESLALWMQHKQGALRITGIVLSVLVLLCCTLVSPVHAQGSDQTRPVIVHEPIKEVGAGGSVTVEAQVTDDTAVDTVRLHLGFDGFAGREMLFQGNDIWAAEIDASDRKEGDAIRYFISAEDAAGNEQSRGFDFDPFQISVGPRVLSSSKGKSQRTSNNRLYYYVAGAAGIVLVALLASGGGDDDDSYSLNEPVIFQ